MFRVFPTVAEAIEVHRLVIQEYGGLDGIRDKGLLESAVSRPQTGYYQDIFEEAFDSHAIAVVDFHGCAI